MTGFSGKTGQSPNYFLPGLSLIFIFNRKQIMNKKMICKKTVPKKFKYVAGVLLSIIKRENLDKDEIMATLECWTRSLESSDEEK